MKAVSRREANQLILQPTDFTQQPLQKIAIAGETGSGKTTLLKIIAGLTQPSSGEVWFQQQRVQGPEEKLIPGHPQIAYLSQYFELRNNYRVEEELEAATRVSPAETQKISEICHIQHLLKRKTTAVSGGERQRIVLARLLLGAPRLLLLDEPFSNLDNIHKQIIRQVITSIGEKLPLSCIMVSHDAPDILSWAHRILVMKEGRILQQGTPEEVYRQPVNEYCAALFGHYKRVPATLFHRVTGATTTEEHLLLRPEQVLLVREKDKGVPGKVISSRFFGSYSLVDIAVNGHIVQAKTDNGQYRSGETVYLSLYTKPDGSS